MTDSKKDDEPKVTPEGQRKGDELLKRMLQTPPKPHSSNKAAPKKPSGHAGGA
jgi:hypothetical protein